MQELKSFEVTDLVRVDGTDYSTALLEDAGIRVVVNHIQSIEFNLVKYLFIGWENVLLIFVCDSRHPLTSDDSFI